MEIHFKDKKIRQLCENQAAAVKKMGIDSAKKLKIRLSALDAAKKVTDLIAGNPHPLTKDRLGQYALNLAGGWRLVFSPANDPCPTLESGGVDWSNVTIVCIEYIGDYHD